MEKNDGYNANGYSLGRMGAGRCLFLLERSGCLSLPVIAVVEWLHVVVHGCLGSMVTCRRLWLLGLNGCW